MMLENYNTAGISPISGGCRGGFIRLLCSKKELENNTANEDKIGQ